MRAIFTAKKYCWVDKRENEGEREIKFRNVKGCQENFYSIFKLFHPDISKKFSKGWKKARSLIREIESKRLKFARGKSVYGVEQFFSRLHSRYNSISLC